MKSVPCLAAALSLLAVPAFAVTPVTPAKASADLLASGGAKIGTASMSEGPRGVVIRLDATGLPPGWHGLHLHMKGACSDPKFDSAGGHTHGGDKSVHGLLNPASTDTGDLPNVMVGADGRLQAEVFTSFVTLGAAAKGGRQAILDADGAAILIHANADDHMSQPIGGAGARIACGVVKASR